MGSITESAIPLIKKHQSEQMGSGANACRTTVIIHHQDTLNAQAYPRKLPKGIIVTVYDESGMPNTGVIDDNGNSTHYNVRCGDISWQLMWGQKARSSSHPYDNSGIRRQIADQDESFEFGISDGYVLVKANGITSKEPRKQFSEPLKIPVVRGSDGTSSVEAVYLPPPMLLNLRFQQEVSDQKKQIDNIIQQIKADGGHTTLFIHGYNVNLGSIGHFPTHKDLTQHPPYPLPLDPKAVQRPYLYYGDIIGEQVQAIMAKAKALAEKSYHYHSNTDQQSESAPKRFYDAWDIQLNGSDALAWFPNVEYYLNLAASGKTDANEKFTDWEKYSRIIGVTWSGNVTPSNVFFRAEMYANETGRALAKILIRLIQAGIKINIITHSLGARVALAALNILGDFDGQYNKEVDNLIMLEAAVADNAITGNDEQTANSKTNSHSGGYTRDKNPVAMELFPFAHRVTKYIRVLYSQEDGVLGADNSLLDLDDGISDLGRGAYPKKYGILANKTNALGDYYPYNEAQESSIAIQRSESQLRNLQFECLANMGQNNKQLVDLCDNLISQPLRNKRGIENEINELIQKEINAVEQNWETELNILRPWSHFRRFPEHADYAKHIIDVLTTIIFRDNWKLSAQELEIRPALGHVGEKFTAPVRVNEKLTKNYPPDNFILNLKDKRFFFWNQSEYFTSHSAMRDLVWEEMTRTEDQINNTEPTRFARIYQESYKEQIMDKYIKGTSTFGRY